MSRRLAALKPQLNRIRAWAHEGSTDAWIAHQLDTTADAVRAFRQEHGIERGGPAPLAPITPDSVVEAMLAEEAAALEAGPEPSEPEPAAETPPARTPRRRTRKDAAAETVESPGVEGPEVEAPEAPEASEAPPKPARRRSTRGGASRAEPAAAEAPAPAESGDEDDESPAGAGEPEPESSAVAHEEEHARPARKRGRRRGRGRGGSRGLEARLLPGSVLLLDAAVTADATFQEHWQDAGHLRVEVTAETIVLRRAVADAEPDRSDR